MTMVPAPKLSKPHLIFYGGCGAASPEVMSRFGDGCSSGAGAGAGGGGGYNNINGNHHHDDATTTADNIITNKVDKSSNNNNNKVISSVLGSDLGIGHPHHHHHNINIVMADEQQQQQQQHSRNSNNSVNNDDGGDGSGGVIRQRSNSVANTREDDDVMDSSSWLQLGLGGGGGTQLGSSSPHQVESTAPRTSGSGALMLELNLGGGFHHHRHNHNHNQTTPFQMPGLDSRVPQTPPHGSVGGGSVSGPTTFVSPHHQILISSLSPQSQLYLLHQQQQQLQLQLQQQQLGWGLMNQRTTMSASMSPSSSSSLPPQQQVLLPAAQSGIPPFFTRPFTSSGASVDDAPDHSEFRLIHPPPRRPHSGIWFSLHASLHQSKEPFLPQVSKNFLRIKDGRMTVRLVMKYLANKLGLDNESEVEIRCRGQQLVPFLTLQHVRDNIWSPREAAVTLLPDSSTSDHLMVLNYGRSTTSSAYNYLT